MNALNKTLSAKETQDLVRGIQIPPCPAVVTDLMKERAKPEPDPGIAAKLISKDVSLSAAVIKAVNSPFFGLRTRVASVPQAITLMGLNNVANVLTSLVMRHLMANMGKKASVTLQKFWDNTGKVAVVSSFLATRLRGISADEAYTYGLFHHCGIPLLMQRDKGYINVVANAVKGQMLTEAEEQAYQTNHAIIGHLLAKSWYLPDTIAQAILNHHDPEVLGAGGQHPEATLVAIGYLAEKLVADAGDGGTIAQNEWARNGEFALRYFGLTTDDFTDLESEALQHLKEEA